jgi:hypothetical protein
MSRKMIWPDRNAVVLVGQRCLQVMLMVQPDGWVFSIYKLGFGVHLDHSGIVEMDHSHAHSMESHDILHSARKPKGYVKLAKFMVKRNHVVLAKYRELAIRDLLYLQAELCDIEYRLKEQEDADANSADERQYHDREWWLLQSAEKRGLGGEHWKLVLCMREKLREFCK